MKPSRYSQIVFIALIALTFSACGSKTPPCGDPQTLGLVKQICRQSLEQQVASTGLDKSLIDQIIAAVPLDVVMIRTTSHEEKIGKYTCEASLEATLPDKLVKAIGKSPIRLSDHVQYENDRGIFKSNVQYTSQMTEGDKKQHMSQMLGHAPLMEVLLMFASQGAFISEEQASAKGLPELEKYVGQPSVDIFKEPLVVKKFKALLSDNFDHFRFNLNLATDLKKIGDSCYFGSGCSAALCHTEKAAFTIEKPGDNVRAVVLFEGKQFKAYGVSKMTSLPAPLLEWVKDNGGQVE